MPRAFTPEEKRAIRNGLHEAGRRLFARRGLTRTSVQELAGAVGIAQGALDYAAQYAQDRVQFGRSISQFQGLRFMLADMATQTEAARTLVYKAAGMIGQKAETSEMHAAMAKCFASDVAMKVTNDAVQMLGGYGYIKDYPVERMMRDAKVIQIFGWSNEAQREIVAQHLVKE